MISPNETSKTEVRDKCQEYVDSDGNTCLDLGTMHFKEANEIVRRALDHCDTLHLNHVLAQRYLGCAMPEGKHLEIHGVPGNDMAAYMDGGRIEVYGNAQDQIGNTMNMGTVVIHGRCGDAAGYAMRGGEIFVRDDCGWRVGIHMKQYKDKRPVIVVGGDAGNFLGEYMAGGMIVLLGEAGKYLGSGMHGGVIYLKNKISDSDIPSGLMQEKVDASDKEELARVLKKYNEFFGDDLDNPVDASGEGFYKLIPKSSRPYASMYVN